MSEERETAERLAQVYDLVGPLYRRVLRKVELDGAGAGVSAGVRAVLDMLRKQGPLTVPQMGRAQSLSRQFVQRMTNEAAALGYVEAVPNPAHKRSSLIRLTEEGRAAIAAVVDREHAELARLHGRVDAADVEACVRVLTEMLGLLDDVDVN
ncbi:MarR family winged helix-turn-helix transcriptional regulator [Streptomyces sp. VRA16 Mangrove soil]|uniref:MarR family winged helix-turn-helix transcriptional regulator n=1 Tax=Streptomyces sp. VRA16 Mangrove soil TaxID=2817434 RepID=UPI001A9D9207|nr:MarR family transcriptional regulator [Streptomyces sp. VRA16 Mangrove soil]MBO1332079.1 MarR family transcriptional regulator [Streptomyces sp. VRA16 Mangrove soil]